MVDDLMKEFSFKGGNSVIDFSEFKLGQLVYNISLDFTFVP
jgi:hypothetical protein